MHISAQRAKARARQRTRPAKARPANDNVVQLPPPLDLTAGDVVLEDSDDAPFAPPPADDIFGLGECEDEETIFIAESGSSPTDDIEHPEEAPFDPPEFEDEPVFTAPPSTHLAPGEPEPGASPRPPPLAMAEAFRDRPLPAISIYMGWDRAESETLMRALAGDPRLARADIEIQRGGIDGATASSSADLFLLDTTLESAAMLAALDRLRAMAPNACVVMLGAVNDIALLRDLAARGVSDYIVPPAKADDVARTLCALFADAEPAQVIAVIGARGGVGASTIARNLAWSIAERQQRKTTLVDLDLSFGSVAASLQRDVTLSVTDVIGADDPENALTRALIKETPRLQLLAAPAKTQSLELDPLAFEDLLANVRRASTYVVLDLPHAWEPWVRMALREADEVVVVAGPDLASLRNADNMLKLLRSERDKPRAPSVTLSMTGLPKRPEIPLKDFSEALCAKPAALFAFEPELFGAAEADGRMIYETMPDAKAALQLDALASMLTGHEPVARPAPRDFRRAVVAAPADSAPKLAAAADERPVLDLVAPTPVTAAQAESPRRRRQRTARTGFVALQEPALPSKRRSTGLVRALAAVAALAALGVWFVGQRQRSPEPAPSLEAPATFSA